MKEEEVLLDDLGHSPSRQSL